MPSERIQRQIDRLLDAAEAAFAEQDWASLHSLARQALALDRENADAQSFAQAAAEMLGEGIGLRDAGIGSRVTGHGETAAAAGDREPLFEGAKFIAPVEPEPLTMPAGDAASSPPETRNPLPDTRPKTFVGDRYEVIRFLGEGGKKQVYLARDKTLNREVAFALIKTEGLDEVGRQRILREGQAMGTLGSHPHIVTVFDLGELPATSNEQRATSAGAGQPYMVTELMKGGDVEGLLEKALRIADEVCQGLEFAHSKGIVHRDLKPGNVWLTDGVGGRESGVGEGATPTPYTPHPAPAVAKIGDFGLAVSLDRTRLTQAGMMVGTVSYMPPEQATGGAVTPQSDLYSLGAMLYEMVTGRPPFLGDEIVAVIGQHLNTPPVSPAWHRHDCPPGLEALILRLLEKDPSRRPESATAVRQAIQSIAGAMNRAPTDGPGSVGARHASPSAQADDDSPATLDNPLYRRVFVGREAELRQLQTAFDQALSGQGGLMMVVGEPGIGKTALVEQLATYATLRGGSTLWRHCYEEGSLSLPYLALVEALRSYVTARPAEALRQELGTAASDVARIVSEVRERLAIEPRPPSEPEEDRWRLLQAVSGFLRNASSVQPLVIVLEDLHWADQGTLDLLTHLARNLQGARLLVIGSYRDVEVDRAHPLSAALADLRRQASFSRVQLHGLGTPEVQRMLLAIAGQNVPGSLAETIHRQTEGNPLFVQEVVRYLVEEGKLGQGSGEGARPSTGSGRAVSETGSAAVDMAIPEGLRDVIGRRIARLSPECNRLLAIAAVIGRDFDLATLRQIAGVEEETLVTAVEAATRVGVLEERSRPGVIRYRFAHAFFRQTLYEELIAPRRLRLHQQVAAALERQYATRLEEHAAELAEHFAQSTDPEDLRKAVRYGELAAERALSVYAYGEAVRHLEQALAVQEVLDPDDKAKRCDLLLTLGDALQATGVTRRVDRVVAPAALACAEAIHDEERAARACLIACQALVRHGASGSEAFRGWAQRLDRYAKPNTPSELFAHAQMARALTAEGRYAEAWERTIAYVDLVRRLNSPDRMFIGSPYFFLICPPRFQAEALRLTHEIAADSRAGVTPRSLTYFLNEGGYELLRWGDRAGAERLFAEIGDIAARTRYPAAVQREMLPSVVARALAGDWAGVLAEADALVRLSEEGESGPWAWGQVGEAVVQAKLALGRFDEALIAAESIPADSMLGPGKQTRQRALCLVALGRQAEARALAASLLAARGLGPEPEFAPMDLVVRTLELTVALGDRDGIMQIAGLLREVAGLLSITQASPTAVARHLGAAAALLGEREQAMRYYEQALEVCGRLRFRPEIALTHLGIAELLLDAGDGFRVSGHGDEAAGAMNRAPTDEIAGSDSVGALHAVPSGSEARAEAMRHLDIAIAELRDMKMQPALERALRRRELLHA